jgi:release factor glutamine methyltransferase
VSDPRPAAIRRLTAAGVDNPRLDARLLWDHAQHNSGMFESYIRRRIAREPVAIITGHKEFWSLDFEVGPGVLIPRPETETIVEQVLDRFPASAAPLKILDLGTGSGCLLISLLKEFPSSRGLGIDSSENSRAIAARNIAHHGLAARAEIAAGNWTEDLAGGWDVVVSNPPYIRTADIAGLAPEVRDYEPVTALDGGPDGLDAVRALAAGFRHFLTGTAFVEIGAGQAASAQSLMAAQGLSVVHIAPDLAGIPRVLVIGLPAPGAKKELE